MIKKIVTLLFLLQVMAVSAALAGRETEGAASLASPDEYTDQIVVKLRDESLAKAKALPNARVAALSASAGVHLKHHRAMSGKHQVFKLPRHMHLSEAEAVARRLSADPDVEYAEPDRRMSPMMIPNDPSYYYQWHYKSPGAPDYQPGGADLPGAWDITTGSSNIVVAVIDTGIVNHAEFQGRTVPGYNFISDPFSAGNGVGRSADPSDLGDWVLANQCYYGSSASNSTFHGSHVAGTIGAASNNGVGVAGINWTSKILPVRVLGKCGGYNSDIADAMRWAAGLPVSGVPINPNPAKVMNLSLGGSGTCSNTMQSAIDAVTAAGATVVVAAGNSQTDASQTEPASCRNVIAVAAVNQAGGRAYYSNYGSSVKIAAPGGEQIQSASKGVLSTLNSGTTTPAASPTGDTYRYFQGTSMATPHVTGIASLLLSVKPTMTPAEVLQTLQATARPFPTNTGSTGGDCTYSLCGAGIVDAARALQSLEPAPVIAASSASLSFTATGGGANPDSKSFAVSNSGGGTLQWSASDDAAWLTLSPLSGTGDGMVTATANIAGLAAGLYHAAITVTGAGSGILPLKIPVQLAVEAADSTPPTVTSFSVPAVTSSLTVPVTAFTATDNVQVAGYLVTASVTAPTASAAGWSATPPASYTFPTAGVKTLYAWTRDDSGNVSAPRLATVTIDTTAPAVAAFAVKSPVNSSSIPVISFTASDNTGIAGYLITESPATPDPSGPNWLPAAPVAFTASSVGDRTLYAWVKDLAGNVSQARSAGVLFDQQPPTVTAFQVPALVNTLAVPILTFTAADNMAVNGYLVTLSATPPAATGAGWSLPAPASFTASSSGQKTLYAWARDTAGNVSAMASATVNIDMMPPTLTTFSATTPVNTFTASLTLSASDSTGVTGYFVSESPLAPSATAGVWSGTPPTSYTFSTAGIKTLYAWAKDVMGNVSAAKSAAVNIDMTAPTLTSFSLKSPVNSLTVPIGSLFGSDNTAVTGYLVTESPAAPKASTPGWKLPAPVSYVTGSPGFKTLYAWARDGAGNVSLSRSANADIDLEPPAITEFAAPALVRSLAIPISAFSATDNGSVTGYLITLSSTPPLGSYTTWKPTPPASYYVSTSGVKTLYAWTKDAAGNVSAAKSATVNVDLKAPVITAFTPKTPVNSLTVPIVNFSATDSTGVTGYIVTEFSAVPLPSARWSSTPPASYTFATPGFKMLYAWARDEMGNVSATKSASIKIDVTAPSVTAFSAKGVVNSLTVPITAFTGSDNAAVTGYLVTQTATPPAASDTGWKATAPTSYPASSAGTTTLYGWVKDGAGNVSAARTASTTIDLEAPAVTGFSTPALTRTLAIPITAFSAMDNRGVTGYLVTLSATPPAATVTTWRTTPPTSFSVTTGGVKTLYAWAKDAAGNVSPGMPSVVTVDLTAPVITSFAVTSPVGTMTVPITSFTANDSSGIAGYLVKESYTTPLASSTGWSETPPAGYTFATSGSKTLYAWVKDGAGNVSAAKAVTVVVPAL